MTRSLLNSAASSVKCPYTNLTIRRLLQITRFKLPQNGFTHFPCGRAVSQRTSWYTAFTCINTEHGPGRRSKDETNIYAFHRFYSHPGPESAADVKVNKQSILDAGPHRERSPLDTSKKIFVFTLGQKSDPHAASGSNAGRGSEGKQRCWYRRVSGDQNQKAASLFDCSDWALKFAKLSLEDNRRPGNI